MEKGTRSKDDVMQVPIVWSGGTDGVLSPHATVFATLPADHPDAQAGKDEPRLTVGFAMSEQLLPEDIGRTPMIEKVAAAVEVAMERAGITDPADVHYVQTKTPLLTIHTIRDAKSRGKTVWTEHTHESMDLSNGTTALGIAVALGEIEMPTDADVMHDRSLFSAVASCSSGVELDQAQVVVVGNATGVGGRYRIGHSVMKDALDADGIWAAVRAAGLDLPERPHSSDLGGRLVNVFLKCEASQDGQVRGRRNAMLDDSDVHWHRQIKATVGGVTASVTGDPAVFVSVSAAHQGPDGGGPVAAIVDLGDGEPTGYRPPSA
jgi:cyanuric acid amidohydrolase